MIRSLLIILLLALGFAACEKNNADTTPKIKIKSTNTGVVAQNQSLIIRFEFTDKEGDVDSLVMLRNRLNKRGTLSNLRGPFILPSFPATSKGEIELEADYNFALTFGINPLKIPGSVPDKFEPDTMKLRFYAVDLGGNRSDTVDLDVIVIR